MDLNGYFDPVSLNRPEYYLLPEGQAFSRDITIHTPDQPIKNIDKYQLAIIGVPQDRGGFIKGSASAPDHIRGMLYQLRRIDNVKIYDLGNLKITDNVNDAYYAIRDISLDLIEREVIPLIIGGSQDLTHGIIMALEKLKGLHQVLTIDPRLDFWPETGSEINSTNYLNSLFDANKKFTYSNIGHQLYFTSGEQLDMLEEEFMESLRLGEIKENLKTSEPLIRDADVISLDMNSVRHSDAPGVTIPSPNGFFGNEICTLTRYAGISEKVKVFGMFEVAPGKDLNDQTGHLSAQAIWYFIEGFSNRVKENPYDTGAHTKKFIITLSKVEQELHFYKSNLSDRWWIEIPFKNPATDKNYFISCSYEDYKLACSNQIPDRWWRYYHRYSLILEDDSAL